MLGVFEVLFSEAESVFTLLIFIHFPLFVTTIIACIFFLSLRPNIMRLHKTCYFSRPYLRGSHYGSFSLSRHVMRSSLIFLFFLLAFLWFFYKRNCSLWSLAASSFCMSQWFCLFYLGLQISLFNAFFHRRYEIQKASRVKASTIPQIDSFLCHIQWEIWLSCFVLPWALTPIK